MLNVVINGEKVCLRGEPWYFAPTFLYFPRQRVFLIGEGARYYDPFSIDGLLPEGVGVAPYTALPLYGEDMEILHTVRAITDLANQEGMKQVQSNIKKALGI